MKTKRRQELKTNDLAAWLEEVSQSFSRWGWWVIGGLAVIVLVFAINVYMKSARAEAQTQAYTDLRRARSLQTGTIAKTDEEIRSSLATIDDLVAKSSDADFKIEGLLAKAGLAMRMAQQELDKGSGGDGAPGRDTVAVKRYLDDARAAYESIANDFPKRTLYRGRGLYGLFQVEALAFVLDGDNAHRTKGQAYLEKLRDDAAFNATPLQTVAIDLLNDIDKVFTVVELPKKPAPALPPVPLAPGAVAPGAAAPGSPNAAKPKVGQLPVTIKRVDNNPQASPPAESAPPEAVPPEAVPPDESDSKASEDIDASSEMEPDAAPESADEGDTENEPAAPEDNG